MNRFKKTIYVSHQFQNNPQNIKEIETIVKYLIKVFPDYCFISPSHAFGYLYDCTDYQQGIDMCLSLMDICDELWVFSEPTDSVGVGLEIECAVKNSIPYKIFPQLKCFNTDNILYLKPDCIHCDMYEQDLYECQMGRINKELKNEIHKTIITKEIIKK